MAMDIGELERRLGAERALVGRHDSWLYAKAREIDIANEADMQSVHELDLMMKHYMGEFHWIGVSSNNIYWTATEAPISVVRVPYPDREGHTTLLNPQIAKRSWPWCTYPSFETCGAKNDESVQVMRHTFFKVDAFELIRGEPPKKVQYSYRLTEKQRQSPDKVHPVAIMQHEFDHLQGILIFNHPGISNGDLSLKSPRAPYSGKLFPMD